MSEHFHQQNYTYYAFISYKRADTKWAQWLQHRLQSYRLPTRLCKQHRMLPKRLTPVFLDRENLTSGELESSLGNELAASRYLIVICSRAAHDQPYYLNHEIRAFLDAGHTPDQIIPFIVDNSAKPEEECFPPALQEACQEHNLLGINIHDSGSRNAFLKVVAYMHGLKLTEVESAEDKRRRRNRWIAILCSAVVLLCLGFAGYQLWDYYVPKVAYYLDYTTVFGIPVGIHEVSKEEILCMPGHYTLITLGDRRYEIRYENSRGNLIENTHTEYMDRPIHAVFECPVDGKLSTVTYYDRNGQPVTVMEYDRNSPNKYRQTVDLIASGTEFETKSYLNANSMAMDANAWSADRSNTQGKSEITRYLVDYTEEGYVSMMRYADSDNRAVSDYDGVWGLAYVRDSMGRVLTMHYLTYNGFSQNAIIEKDYAHKTSGLCGRKYEYNELDCLSKTTYFGPDEKPMLNPQGWMICAAIHDDPVSPYRVSREDFLDANGMPLGINGSDTVTVCYTYNSQGYKVKQEFIGADGQYALYQGRAIDENRYDENGYVSETLCHDADRKLTAIQGSICGEQYINDGNGNVLRETMIGADGEPVADTDGYSQMVYEYDDKWHLISITYLDIHGHETADSNGISRMKFEYNPQGLLERATRLGPDGQSIMGDDGYAGWQNEYSLSGNLIRSTFLDEYGVRTKLAEGYSTFAYEYDRSGRIIKSSYLDEQDNLVNLQDGYAYEEREYDDNGKLIRDAYYDAQSTPVIGPEGYAARVVERNADGNIIQQRYLGPDGNLFVQNNGYAFYVNHYEGQIRVQADSFDEQENLLQTVVLNEDGIAVKRIFYEAYDQAGNLINGPDGYAYEEREYDENGYLIRDAYYDAQSTPVIGPEGYAASVRERNADGNITRHCFYDVDRNLLIQNEGYAFYVNHYNRLIRVQEDYFDERENLLLTVILNEDGITIKRINYEAYDQAGNLINGPDGYAYEEREYDDNGKLIRDAYYDAQSTPVIGPEGYAASVRERNADGNITRHCFYDVDGNLLHAGSLINGPDGYAYEEREYDDNGKLIRDAYYDAQGNPVIGPEGYAASVRERNADGNITRHCFYDPDGNLLIQNDGYAFYVNHYDGQIRVQEDYFDEQENLLLTVVLNEDGIAVKRIYYEAYDQAGNLINGPDGYAYEEREYNDNGKLLMNAYYDAQSTPVIGPEGYAASSWEMDANNNITRRCFFGPDGNLLMQNEGFAFYVNHYDGQIRVQEDYFDEQLNLLLTIYLDEAGAVTRSIHYIAYDGSRNLINGPNGYALQDNFYEGSIVVKAVYYDEHENMMLTIHRNEAGEIVKRIQYEAYDENGKLINGSSGYAIAESLYEDGRRVQIQLFNEHAQLLQTLCINEKNLVVKRIYYMAYDQAGNLINGPDGYAYEEREYDDNGKLIRNAYFDADGNPVIGPEGYAASVQERNADGNVIWQGFYDTDGNLIEK